MTSVQPTSCALLLEVRLKRIRVTAKMAMLMVEGP